MSGPAPAIAPTCSRDLAQWLAEETAKVAGWQAAEAPPDPTRPGERKPRPEKATAVPKGFARVLRLLRGSIEQGDLAGAARLADLIAQRARAQAPSAAAMLAVERGPELMQRETVAPAWMVQGIIPTGLALIVSKPKVGKTALIAQIGAAVAGGGSVLGRPVLRPGEALLCLLEDTAGRARARFERWGISPPHGLMMRYCGGAPRELCGLPPLPGTIDALAQLCDGRPDLRLVVIDTVAKVMPERGRGQSSYLADYAAIAALQEFASARPHLSVCILHHERKLDAPNDPFDSVSGTSAILGGSDHAVLLRRTRGSSNGRLLSVGRDFEESAIPLEYDLDLGLWRAGSGSVEAEPMTGLQAEILAAVESRGEITNQQLYEALPGRDPGTLRLVVTRLVDRGKLRRVARGVVASVASVANSHGADTFATIATIATADVHETATSDTTAAREEVRP